MLMPIMQWLFPPHCSAAENDEISSLVQSLGLASRSVLCDDLYWLYLAVFFDWGWLTAVQGWIQADAMPSCELPRTLRTFALQAFVQAEQCMMVSMSPASQ